MEEKETNLFIQMEPELKNQFKAKCALAGSNMTEVIRQLIQQYVSDETKSAKAV